MPRNLVPDSPQELSDAELIRKGQLAVQLASDEIANREEVPAPNDGDGDLVGENPWRSGLIIHNPNSARLLVGWGSDEVTDTSFSFPVPTDSTYHPANQTWWNVPKTKARYRLEGGASGKIYVTDFRLQLSPGARSLLTYIRENL